MLPISSYASEYGPAEPSRPKPISRARNQTPRWRRGVVPQPIDDDPEDHNFAPPVSASSERIPETREQDFPIRPSPTIAQSVPDLDLAYKEGYAPSPPMVSNNPQTIHSPAPSGGDMVKKLDYLIHMVEEQRDQKTGQVMEELVLYSFIGVFVIFTIDSFTKAGKYSR
jgi:hypothetical protein